MSGPLQPPDGKAPLRPNERRVLERLRDGPLSASELVQSSRVRLLRMEKDLGVIVYDNGLWHLTSKGLAELNKGEKS